jgi:hypothetical protein
MFAKTNSREVLGTLNNFAFELPYRRRASAESLEALSVYLAHTPIIGKRRHGRWPDEETRALFSVRH